MSYQRTIINPITKRKYADSIQATFYETFWPYKRFSKGGGKDLGGELLQVPIRLTRNWTGAAGGESTTFPGASNSTWSNLQLRYTYYRNSAECTHMALSDTANGASAFANALDVAKNEGIEGLIRQISQDIYASRFCARAVVFADSNLNDGALTLRSQGSANVFNTRPMDLVGSRWLMVNQRVQIYDPATGNIRVDNTGVSDFYVSALTNTGSIVLRKTTGGLVADWTGGGCTDGDIIVPFGSFNWGAATSDNPVGYGVHGLSEFCSNGTYTDARLYQNYGIAFNRTGVVGMDGVVLVPGAVITETNIENLLDAIGSQYRRLDEGGRGLFITRREIVNQIKKFKYGDTWFEPGQARLGIKASALSFEHGDQPIDFEIDANMIPGTVFAVNQEELEWYELDPPQVEEKDGQMLRLKQQVSGTNVLYQQIYEILFYTRLQFWSPVPAAHGMITSLTADPEFGMANTFLPIH